MSLANNKVAAYIRLSKEDEKEGESESITNQKELIIKYMEHNNLGLPEFFIDDGYSGGNFDRPGFKRMIEKIENREIRVVITKDTSRLGRDFIETSQYMFKYFPEHNVRYIAILENFDTFNPNGVEDMIPFQTIINDWYLKDTSKKIKSVRQNKMRQGLYMGSTVPYGYKRSKANNCKFEIDEYSSEIVKRIFKMRLDGVRPTMIARNLSDEKISPPSIYNGKNIRKTYTTYIWGISTINQILTNQIYIGNLIQRKFDKASYRSKKKIKLDEKDWIIVPDCVPSIISKEDFKRVQEMKKNNINIGTKGYDYLLKGLVVCGDCGKIMTVRRRYVTRKLREDKEETYYCCSTNIRYRNGVCSFHYYQENKLNEIVINYLRAFILKYANTNELEHIGNNTKKEIVEIQNFSDEIVKLQEYVERLKVTLKELYIDKSNDVISENDFIELKQQLENDEEDCIKRINELNKKIDESQKEGKESSNIEKRIKEFMEFKNPSKIIIMEFIQKIEIMKNKTVNMYVNFNLDTGV